VTEIETSERSERRHAVPASERLAIEARGLSRRFRQGPIDVHALQKVDLAVAPGELVAVMGASGSGKSTLLHLLGGLDRPDSGDVVVEGQALSELDETGLALLRRRRIGFVLQFFNLMPTLTALENVAFPIALDGVRDARARAEDMLALVGLVDRGRHRPSELSGGEQQRVALARALVVSPAVVLADEPTGSLDRETGRAVLGLMRALAASGQAIVLATHDPDAARYATRTVRLADGTILDSA